MTSKTIKTTKTTKATQKTAMNPHIELAKLRTQYQQIRLQIKAGQNKNTNAHLSLKKQIAQLLTKINQKA